MNPAYRYILYILIGMGLYFVIKQEGDEERTLDQVHQVAPYVILVLLVLMFFARAIRKKRGE